MALNINNNLILKLLISYVIYQVIVVLIRIAIKNITSNEKLVKGQTKFISEALILLDEKDSKDEFKLKDIIKYSDPMSVEDVKKIEETILNLLNDLNEANVSEIKKLITRRNNIIKSLK